METWYKIREPYDTVYDDVKLHLFGPDWYKSGDKVHQTHERTHGINARLRDKHKVWDCWYYVLNDTAFCLNMPDGLRIRDIARKVPREMRKSMYDTYLTSRSVLNYWDDEPGYLLDELTAYHNGTLCARELFTENDDAENRYKYSKRFFYELLEICEIIPQLFPEGYDRSHFDGIMEFMRAAAL